MFSYVISTVLANHSPRHGKIKYSGWVQRKCGIMFDKLKLRCKNFLFRVKQYLLGCLSTKIKEKCDQELT